MRKTTSVLLALGILVTLQAPVNAKKPVPPPGPEPVIGLTCEELSKDPDYRQINWQIDSKNVDFELTLDADHPAACFDVVSRKGDWQIEILEAVSAAYLQVQVKDSVPGDFCYREGFGKKTNPIPDSPWTIVEIPASDINACTPGEVGLAADEDPALVFMVAYTPERKTTDSKVTIAVDLP